MISLAGDGAGVGERLGDSPSSRLRLLATAQGALAMVDNESGEERKCVIFFPAQF